LKRVIAVVVTITLVFLPAPSASAGVENIGFFGKVKHYAHGDPVSVYASGFFPRLLCKKRIKFRLKDSAGKKFRMRSIKTEAEGIFTSRQGSPYIGDIPAEAAYGPAKIRGKQKCGRILGSASDTESIVIVRSSSAPTITSASAPDVVAGQTTGLRLNVSMQDWSLTYLTVTVEYEVVPDVWKKVDTVTNTALMVEGGIYRLPWRARLDSAAPAGRYRFRATFTRDEFTGGVQEEGFAEFTVAQSLPGADSPLDGAISTSDQLVVGDTGDDVLAVYDDTGRRVDSWGEGVLDDPKDLDFGPDGKIYVADFNNLRIAILSPTGEFVDEYAEGVPGEDFSSPFSGRGGGPDGIAVDAINKRIYVASRGRGVVYVFPLNEDTNDPLIIEPPEFDSPQDVAVAPDGTLYVADETARTVFHLSPTGTILGQLDDDYLGPARSVSVAPDGNIYVVAATTAFDVTVHRVFVYNPAGTLIDSYGAEILADTSGVIAAGTAGDVYVLESGPGKIYRFRRP
jgi:sugar lactone lactonase YvrE